MVTGDALETAVAVAKHARILKGSGAVSSPMAMTGSEFVAFP